MAEKFEIRFNSDPRYLRVVRGTMSQICELAGFTRFDSSKIVLAVDEACSNVIRHAYKGQSGQPITIRVTIDHENLEIDIMDQGEQVDKDDIKPRPLEELRPGGLGVHLIRTVMDDVIYQNLAKVGNRLVLIKALPKGKVIESQN